MPVTPLYLGKAVNYRPPDSMATGSGFLAAIIIALQSDGTADLRVFPGYCQGTIDVAGVKRADDPADPGPGTYSPPIELKGVGKLNKKMGDTSNTVQLVKEADAVEGDNLRIEKEYMTVTDASNPKSLGVNRAQGGSVATAHAADVLVLIGVALPSS